MDGNCSQPVPQMAHVDSMKPYSKLAEHEGTVGLMLKNCQWAGFFFPLKFFKNPNTSLASEVFGIVINWPTVKRVIYKLSTTTVAQRAHYSISLESR